MRVERSQGASSQFAISTLRERAPPLGRARGKTDARISRQAQARALSMAMRAVPALVIIYIYEMCVMPFWRNEPNRRSSAEHGFFRLARPGHRRRGRLT